MGDLDTVEGLKKLEGAVVVVLTIILGILGGLVLAAILDEIEGQRCPVCKNKI